MSTDIEIEFRDRLLKACGIDTGTMQPNTETASFTKSSPHVLTFVSWVKENEVLLKPFKLNASSKIDVKPIIFIAKKLRNIGIELQRKGASNNRKYNINPLSLPRDLRSGMKAKQNYEVLPVITSVILPQHVEVLEKYLRNHQPLKERDILAIAKHMNVSGAYIQAVNDKILRQKQVSSPLKAA